MTFIKLGAEHGSAWVNPAQIAFIHRAEGKWRHYRVCFASGNSIYLNEENFNLLVLELGL